MALSTVEKSPFLPQPSRPLRMYMSDKYADEANTIASKKMFDMVGIKYRIYEKTGRKLTIEL